MTRRAVSGATALSYVFWVLLAANIGLGAVLFLAAPEAAAPAGSASGPGGRDACGASRPFANLREALSHATRLDADGGRAEVREVVARGRPDHVVYIEPAASRDAARRVLRELEGQSIAGQVVDAGPLANAVTLGGVRGGGGGRGARGARGGVRLPGQANGPRACEHGVRGGWRDGPRRGRARALRRGPGDGRRGRSGRPVKRPRPPGGGGRNPGKPRRR